MCSAGVLLLNPGVFGILSSVRLMPTIISSACAKAGGRDTAATKRRAITEFHDFCMGPLVVEVASASCSVAFDAVPIQLR
jgi:hypothetical protein